MVNELSVAFDREIFLVQQFGGVSKSFVKNIEIMEKRRDLGLKPQLTFTRTTNRHLIESNAICASDLNPARRFFQPRSGLGTLVTLGPIRATNSIFSGGHNPNGVADIGHATYYRPQLYDFRKIRRLAVTIHDFIPEDLNWRGIRNPHIGKSKLIRKADLVVCISETTRNLLYEKFGSFHDNVIVVPHGTDLVERNFKVQEVFPILYIGHRKGYKNFSLLVNALAGLNKVRPYQLWIAGPPLDLGEKTELNARLGINWMHFSNPSDRKITELLSKAAVHCVTSRMEGFGMTAVEAIGAGCPVIATDIPIFRETLRGNGILVNPLGSEELRNELISLMINQSYYDSVQSNLLNIRESYSWEQVTPKLIKGYRGLF